MGLAVDICEDILYLLFCEEILAFIDRTRIMIRSLSLARQTVPVRWVSLLLLSLALAGLLEMLRLPAALLLGPMIAGIVISTLDGGVDIPDWAFSLAQGLLGCMIGGILAKLLGTGSAHWGVLIAGALSVVVFSSGLGWLLSRTGLLPGTTALWGMSPGAASAMTVMSEEFGADPQLVGLMQYLRMVIVAMIASTGARLLGATVPTAHAAHLFGLIQWEPLAATVILTGMVPLIGHRFKIRAGAMLLPMIVSVALIRFDIITLDLPRWLLAIAYAVIGWRVGLRFTLRLLVQAARALPQILLCTFALIALCGGLALMLVKFAGIDPITAWLATNPGGADTAAIIASSSPNVDAGFVMTMQTLRFLSVLLFGPFIAKVLSNRTGAA
jgi:membrane AbrB-like protein